MLQTTNILKVMLHFLSYLHKVVFSKSNWKEALFDAE